MANETHEQRWAARVAAWRASGLTSTAYCQGRDFSAGGLRHWAHLLKKRGVPVAVEPPGPAIHLVRVETPASTAASAPAPPPAPLTVELGGARLSVPAGFDTSTLRTVLEALGAPGAGGRR